MSWTELRIVARSTYLRPHLAVSFPPKAGSNACHNIEADCSILVNLPPSPRTHALTDPLATPSSIFLPHPKLSAPLLSSPERRFWSARFRFSLPASLSQLARRPRMVRVEERVQVLKVAAAAHLDEDVVADAAVVDVLAPLHALLVE